MQYLKHVVEDDLLFTKVISKFEPVTYSPLLTKHRPQCSEMNNYTIHTNYTITLCRQKLSLTILPFQSESTIPDQIHLFCFVQNCHLVSLIVLFPQQMLKWSKRVSLKSVSFTNYPNIASSRIVHFFFFFLHVYKFYALPNITIYKGYKIKYTQHLHMSQLMTLQNVQKYTRTIVHQFCSMFYTFTSDQQFTNEQIQS